MAKWVELWAAFPRWAVVTMRRFRSFDGTGLQLVSATQYLEAELALLAAKR